MAIKTITVTEEAYHALSHMKNESESFSETILRIAGKRSLKEFAGILSKESGNRLERVVREKRHSRLEAHKKRMERLVKELQGVSTWPS